MRVQFFRFMSDHADEKNAAEDPAAAAGPSHAEGKPMTELERIRHSAAHILATAILRIWPEAQFAAGPPVENGFYYDVELPHRISPADFERIEAEMKKETKANHPFQRVEVSRDEALALAEKGALASLGERPGSPSKFKLDIVQNIPEGETITLYKNGDFTDLCAGPHVGRTGNVGAFKLTHVTSTYYKNDERNPQLSGSTARRSRTARSWTNTSPCWRSRRSATTASWARNSNYSPLTRMSVLACRSGCRAARRSSRNWKSWPRKRSSPLVTSACELRIWRVKTCI